jgi:hypothetical protein
MRGDKAHDVEKRQKKVTVLHPVNQWNRGTLGVKNFCYHMIDRFLKLVEVVNKKEHRPEQPGFSFNFF